MKTEFDGIVAWDSHGTALFAIVPYEISLEEADKIVNDKTKTRLSHKSVRTNC